MLGSTAPQRVRDTDEIASGARLISEESSKVEELLGEKKIRNSGVLRGALSLSLGTAGARGLSALSQVLLVVWLVPAEFGYWAAALASLSFFTSVVNFGEINGYLAGRSSSFRRMRRTTRRMNLALTLIAMLVAVVIGFLNSWTIGVLAIWVALSIPVQGESDVLYALGVKKNRIRRLVLSQVLAAVVKLGLGVCLAMWTQSALAIAISTVAYYLVMILGMRAVSATLGEDDGPTGESDSVTKRERISWAVNSLVMSLPLQVGFFVAQFVTSSATLGLYYFSFQVTLGLSGLLAVPLARVSLASFGERNRSDRLILGMELSHSLAAGVMLLVAIIAIASPIAGHVLPTEWIPAIPVAVIMLASLPIRLISPVIEGFQQSDNRWWQSTAFNAVETIASASIAASLLIVDLTMFALILTGWRLLFGVFRIVYVFQGARVGSMVGLLVAISVGTATVSAAAIVSEPLGFIFTSGTIVGAAIWLIQGIRMRPRTVGSDLTT